MKPKRPVLFMALSFLLLASIWGTAVLAQTSSTFNLEWNVIGHGAQESSSSNYSVTGTIGQSITGQSSGGAGFIVSSGYWFIDPGAVVYLPAVIK